jgi:carbon monoxide dehydrogenase subunit G
MIEAINKIRIERPAWFVFEFLSDIENSPLWEQFDMRAIKITPGIVELGTQYRLVHAKYERTLRVIDYEKDRRIAVVTVEETAPNVALSIRLHPEGDALTLALVDWKLATGLPGLVERLAEGKVKQAVSESLYKLRELLETGSVTLENGREIQMPEE